MYCKSMIIASIWSHVNFNTVRQAQHAWALHVVIRDLEGLHHGFWYITGCLECWLLGDVQRSPWSAKWTQDQRGCLSLFVVCCKNCTKVLCISISYGFSDNWPKFPGWSSSSPKKIKLLAVNSHAWNLLQLQQQVPQVGWLLRLKLWKTTKSCGFWYIVGC